VDDARTPSAPPTTADPSDPSVVEEAIAVAHAVVWATVTTVDTRGRPRSRVMHPVWTSGAEGGVDGWVTTRRTPVKVRHLAGNPHVTCAYLAADHDVATFDCTATWVDDPAGRRRVWDACASLPPPIGFDPATIFPDGPDAPPFAALHLRPYRIQVVRGAAMARGERPRRWTATDLEQRTPPASTGLPDPAFRPHRLVGPEASALAP
jgi:hypothetical protein